MIHLLVALFCVAGMAASFSSFSRKDADYVSKATMTCDSSYPTGGYAVAPGVFGNTLGISDVIPIAQSTTYLATWNAGTACVQILEDTGSGLVEVPNATDLHTLTVILLGWGR